MCGCAEEIMASHTQAHTPQNALEHAHSDIYIYIYTQMHTNTPPLTVHDHRAELNALN